MAMSSAASSSCESGPKGFAQATEGTSKGKPSLLATWAMRVSYMLTDFLKIGAESTCDSQAVLANMDLEDYQEVFSNGHEVLTHFATSGPKGFASSDRIPVMRWKWLDNACTVLANGEKLLADYTPDVKPRSPTVIGDSCLTFKDGNTTPAGTDGKAMGIGHAKRQHIWKDKTMPIVILTQDAARQQEILTLLLAFILTFSIDGNPEEFLGHLIVLFSPNDVKKGNKELWEDKDGVLSVTRQIRNLLRRFPVGTVSILTPGVSKNFGYKPEHNFDKLAEPYTKVLIDWSSCLQPRVYFRYHGA